MKDYIWKSDLAQTLQHYIEYRHMEGFKFNVHERILRHFDHFHYYNGYEGTRLTKEMLHEFIYNKNERPSSHYCKEVAMNQFAKYLSSRGQEAYIPDIQTKLPRCKYIPHIYTRDEIQRFFKAVDNYPESNGSSRNSVDPVLFRFLYCTGARLSEALGLRIMDVNNKGGYVTILGAKNNKDRILPLTTSMMEQLGTYIKVFHSTNADESILFPGKDNGRMDKSTAYNHFRDYLLMADIAHTSNGPRIHDFRHGLAVENLRRWSIAGEDLLRMLPYLSAYMGHADFRATQYYLRMTAEIYPDLVRQMEEHYGDIIPGLEGIYHEES